MAALSNKAPGGYGLGDNGSTILGNDLNNAILGGFYVFSSTVKNSPSFKSGKVLVMPYSNLQYQTQIAFASLTSEIAVRSCNGGSWEPWEYLNPLLTPGMENRTIERYNGKPVYTQLVSCGALEAETMKTVILPVPADWIVSCVGMHGPNVNGHRQASPFYYNNGSTELVFHCAAEAYHVETEDKIYLYLYATQATTESYALLKYTKESA